MTIVSSAWHVLSAGAVFLIGGLVVLRSASYFRVPARRGLFLYLWHSLFCLIYLYYSLNNPSDAVTYYKRSLTYSGGFDVASPFIYLFASVFSRFLGFSYLGVFLVFNIIGCLGLIAVYGALRVATMGKTVAWRRLAVVLALLPSASFWSSAPGKDPVSFMAIGFALWSALDHRRRYPLMILAVVSMFLVRPHMAAMMVSALAISIVIGLRAPIVQRVVLGGVLALVGVISISFSVSYVGLEEASSTEDVIDYVERRQGYNQSGGGAVDIATMSPPAKLLSYLFRPLPHEAHSIPALAASIDNTILLILVALGSAKMLLGSRVELIGNRLFMWLYVFMAWFVLGMTTANLGISMRQKWMFLPVLLFLLLSIVGSRKSANSASRSSKL